MPSGEEMRAAATTLKDTLTGAFKDSSGKMAEFHEDTATITETTSKAVVDKDTDIAGDVAKLHPDATAPKIPGARTPPSSAAEEDAGAKAAAEKLATEKAAEEAAAKAAAEKAAKDAATASRVAELKNEGHGPQRHLDATDTQLEERLGKPVLQGKTPKPQIQKGYVVTSKKIDPARPGASSLPETDPLKYKDNYNVDKSGNPANHKCGSFATAFGDGESMVTADAAARAHIPAGATGRHVVTIDATGAIGADGVAGLRGKYIDPANPLTGTTVNYKDVNFTGAKITAVYDQDASGAWKTTTIYPEPDPAVNP